MDEKYPHLIEIVGTSDLYRAFMIARGYVYSDLTEEEKRVLKRTYEIFSEENKKTKQN